MSLFDRVKKTGKFIPVVSANRESKKSLSGSFITTNVPKGGRLLQDVTLPDGKTIRIVRKGTFNKGLENVRKG